MNRNVICAALGGICTVLLLAISFVSVNAQQPVKLAKLIDDTFAAIDADGVPYVRVQYESNNTVLLQGQLIASQFNTPDLTFNKLKENGKRPTPFHDIADVINSDAAPKDDHEWEQSTVEALHMIEPLTVEKEIVLDPFMGSGTTGLASLELNRRFIGMEIREDHFITAKASLGF